MLCILNTIMQLSNRLLMQRTFLARRWFQIHTLTRLHTHTHARTFCKSNDCALFTNAQPPVWLLWRVKQVAQKDYVTDREVGNKAWSRVKRRRSNEKPRSRAK